MSDMSILSHFIFAIIATLGWTVFFNAPKEDLLHCSLNGAIGWVVFVILSRYTENSVFSNFVASFVVNLLSEILARKLKKPAILYIIPGIIPLVPGLGIYNTMLHMIQGSYIKAIEIGTQVALVAGGIVLGMVVVTSCVKVYYKIKNEKTIKMENKKSN